MEKNEKSYDLAYLERQVDNLTKLVNINSIVNSTLDIKKLLTLIMEIIKDIMDAEASTLLLCDEDSGDLVFKVALGEAGEELTEKYRVKTGQGIAGWVAENRKPLYVNDVYSDDRFDPNYDRQTGFTTRSILCSPLLFKGKLIGVIQAINPVNRPGFDDDDVGLFSIFSDEAALAVQNAIFFQRAIEEERISGEITTARKIQNSLNPNVDEDTGDFNFSVRSVSAREVGGQFHGFHAIDRRYISIFLGDIHLNGIPGAMHASIISGSLMSIMNTKGKNPAVIVNSLNELISEKFESIQNLSLFYGVLDREEKILRFVNSGVGYPILVRNGVARYLRFGRKHDSEPAEKKMVKVKLHSGDSFVILTNGILNVRNRSAHNLGLKRIMNHLEKTCESSPVLVDSLLEFASDFSEGVRSRDDMSVIAFNVS